MPLKLSKLSVLVIDDTKPMVDLISGVLDGLGVGQIYTAVNGEAGLDSVKRLNPDIVLCDWEMPEFNGIEFTKEIRTNTLYPNPQVPIMMMSGYGMPNRVLKARDAGITEFIVKPFMAQDIAKRIVYVVNHPRDFIDSETYTGPDRRRQQKPDYKGPFRREDDQK